MISDPNEELLRSALAGRYEIEGLLGRGGMGVVYLARDLRLERPVALKVPSADRAADPEFRARFLREARTAAALLHPNIVPIYAVHEVGEMILFAMAYVAGETLDQRIEREGALSPETAARLLRELADALAYAHARGVVHRDVKPDNILLDAASGRALLSDFGIARMSGDGRSTAPPSDGGVAGAAAFMSPEQARGEPVDSRSDLYSLGVVGYYALTGRLPFTGETDVLVLALHATTPPPPLVVPGVPRRLAQAVERCLAKHPGDRFPDGAALGRALSQALPQHAVPPIAVRAFLTRSAHLAGPALMYEAFVGLIAAPATLWCWLYTDAGTLCGAAAAALAGLLLLPLVVAWARGGRHRVRRGRRVGGRHGADRGVRRAGADRTAHRSARRAAAALLERRVGTRAVPPRRRALAPRAGARDRDAESRNASLSLTAVTVSGILGTTPA